MTITAAGLKAAVLAEMTAEFGAAQDAGKRDKFATVIGNAVVNYLKTNTVVKMNGNGLDTNGDTLVNNTGTIT